MQSSSGTAMIRLLSPAQSSPSSPSNDLQRQLEELKAEAGKKRRSWTSIFGFEWLPSSLLRPLIDTNSSSTTQSLLPSFSKVDANDGKRGHAFNNYFTAEDDGCHSSSSSPTHNSAPSFVPDVGTLDLDDGGEMVVRERSYGSFSSLVSSLTLISDPVTLKQWVRFAFLLGIITLAANAIQGGLAFWLGCQTSSIALMNFSIDSYVEVLSAILTIIRLASAKTGRCDEEERLLVTPRKCSYDGGGEGDDMHGNAVGTCADNSLDASSSVNSCYQYKRQGDTKDSDTVATLDAVPPSSFEARAASSGIPTRTLRDSSRPPFTQITSKEEEEEEEEEEGDRKNAIMIEEIKGGKRRKEAESYRDTSARKLKAKRPGKGEDTCHSPRLLFPPTTSSTNAGSPSAASSSVSPPCPPSSSFSSSSQISNAKSSAGRAFEMETMSINGKRHPEMDIKEEAAPTRQGGYTIGDKDLRKQTKFQHSSPPTSGSRGDDLSPKKQGIIYGDVNSRFREGIGQYKSTTNFTTITTETSSTRKEWRRHMAEKGFSLVIGLLLLLLAIGTFTAAISSALTRSSAPAPTAAKEAKSRAVAYGDEYATGELILSFTSGALLLVLWIWKLRAANMLRSWTLWADASCTLSRVLLTSVLFIGISIRIIFESWWWVDNIAAGAMSCFIFINGAHVVSFALSDIVVSRSRGGAGEGGSPSPFGIGTIPTTTTFGLANNTRDGSCAYYRRSAFAPPPSSSFASSSAWFFPPPLRKAMRRCCCCSYDKRSYGGRNDTDFEYSNNAEMTSIVVDVPSAFGGGAGHNDASFTMNSVRSVSVDEGLVW